jgi:FAD/FMN-containing dehydrogenase
MNMDADPALVAFAAEIGASDPVAVEGGRTRWWLGGRLPDEARVVRAPSGIVRHRADEMTVTVRTGTSVAELHELLADAGQRTALADRGGTVGGALAVGENHTSLLGRGRVRDALLQVRYVAADGRVVSAGGPTVKNVSGFDLCRIMVGSLGTLGLLAEATLRTNPIPAASCWLVGDVADPASALDAVYRPSAALWDGHTTWVELEGHAPDVAAEAGVLERAGFRHAERGPDLPVQRWSMPPADLPSLPSMGVGRFVAGLGTGLVYSDQRPTARTPDAAAVAVGARLKELFDPTGRLNPGRRVGATDVRP